jgi:cysteine-S-conjugate beta-lyase
MPQNHLLNRRAFLTAAQLTAIAGAVGTSAAAVEANGAPGGKFDFDTPYNRIGTDCIKWDSVIRGHHMDRIIAGMGVADMDFKCAPAITAALQRRVAHENWGETDMDCAGPMAFKKGIIDWNKKHYGIDVIHLDNLEITTGVHPGLQAAIRAFTKPGEKVLLAAPIYNGFYSDIRYAKAVPVESPMKYEDSRYEIDWEDFERRMTPEVKVSILCNPQNPVGRVWSKDEITRYGELCLKHNVIVLADEIFCDILAKGQGFTPFSTLENRAIVDNSITFKSPSKSFSLACMKCAWFFSTNPVLFKAAAEMNSPYLNTLGMIASQAAYAGGEDWMHQCVAYLGANQEFANQYIKANIPMIKVGRKPEGTYLGWIDVTAVAMRIGAQKLADEANRNPARNPRTGAIKLATPEEMVNHWFAHNAFVHMYPGSQYGLGGANHMRINFATSRRTLKAALDSMAGALKKIAA